MAIKRPTDAELKSKLSPEQYNVTQCSATEPPFQNAFWDHHRARHLRGRGLGGAAFLLHGQVRLPHGLAELRSAHRAG